jgi:hypothetical protein
MRTLRRLSLDDEVVCGFVSALVVALGGRQDEAAVPDAT